MRPEQLTEKKVLLGCLDWGSGHIARSVPLIRQLLDQENTVTIWCSEKQRILFGDLLPEVPCVIGFKSGFHFKGDGNFPREILRNAWRLAAEKWKEHRAIEYYIQANQIDYVLSDHRYGMYSRLVPSVFITHQSRLPRKAGFIAQCLHRKWMKPFGAIWIMDEEQHRMAGELSRKIDKATYIGHYSRFSQLDPFPEIPGSIVAIISGPAPYASQLLDQLLKRARTGSGNWTFVCPPELHRDSTPFRFISSWQQADEVILAAELVISRNGYSTLMDLKVLKKRAVLIPTPGQLEQEYLAGIVRNELWRVVWSVDELSF